MSLKAPDQVKAISAAVTPLTEADFKQRFKNIDPANYDGELTDEDFSYTWEWFQGVRDLYQKAAGEGCHVLFTVDQ